MGASLAVPHPHGAGGLAHRQRLISEPQGLPNRLLEKLVPPRSVMMQQQESSHTLIEKLCPHQEKRLLGASLAVSHLHGVGVLAHHQ